MLKIILIILLWLYLSAVFYLIYRLTQAVILSKIEQKGKNNQKGDTKNS